MTPTPPNATGPRVEIKTNQGTIVVELDERVPTTVKNFLSYVDSNFYDGTIFHRIIRGFMIQGGGFDDKMRQKKTNAPIRLEVNPALKHTDGAISMARTSDPNSATAQFFICDGPQRSLDNQYAVFGRVVEGMDVVRTIAKTRTDRQDAPTSPQVIESARRV